MIRAATCIRMPAESAAGHLPIFEIDIMRRRHSLAFRPALEQAEDRCLATVHPLVSHLGAHGLAGQVARRLRLIPSTHGSVVIDGRRRPGAVRASFRRTITNWGAISLWNTTNHRVTFSVSASTYQNGRYFNFTLRPGTASGLLRDVRQVQQRPVLPREL